MTISHQIHSVASKTVFTRCAVRVRGALVCGVIALLAMPASAAGAKRSKVADASAVTWQAFRSAAPARLEVLAAPLKACATSSAKTRTGDCTRRIHSFEVPYALLALKRLTGEKVYGDLANRVVGRTQAAAAQAAKLDTYDSTWFLAYAIEREETEGELDLRASAVAAAERVAGELEHMREDKFAQGVLFGADTNVSWQLLSVWRWAEHVEDDAMKTRLTAVVKTRLLQDDMDSWCPLPVDGQPEPYEFFPPCLQRAQTVLTAMPQQVSNPWLVEFLSAQQQLSPLPNPIFATHASLNFARAAALWSVFQATGDVKHRDMYVAHVKAQMDGLAQWESQGKTVDPWVAAMGVHALAQAWPRGPVS